MSGLPGVTVMLHTPSLPLVMGRACGNIWQSSCTALAFGAWQRKVTDPSAW